MPPAYGWELPPASWEALAPPEEQERQYQELVERLGKATTPQYLTFDEMRLGGLDISPYVKNPEDWLGKYEPTTGLYSAFVNPEGIEHTVDEWASLQAEAEQQRLSDIYDIYSKVFPEKAVVPPTYGWELPPSSIETLPPFREPEVILQELSEWLETDAEGFLETLVSKGKPAEAEELLRGIFPDVTEEEIESVIGYASGYRVVNLMRQHPEVFSAEELSMQWIVNNQGEFLSRLQDEGDTEWTRLAMSYLYPEIPALERRRFLESDDRGWFGKLWGSTVAGIGDILASTGGGLRWLGGPFESFGETLAFGGEALQREGVQDGGLGWEFARMIPMLATLIVPGIGAYAATGAAVARLAPAALRAAGVIGISARTATRLGPYAAHILQASGAAGVSRSLESFMEAGGAYNQMIAMGYSEEEASAATGQVFRRNLQLIGTDIFQFATALMPFAGLKPLQSLLDKGIIRYTAKGAGIAGVALTEGGEEYYQEIIQRQAMGEDISGWAVAQNLSDEEIRQVTILGMMAGGMFAGGAEVMSFVNRTVLKNLPAELQTQTNKDIADGIRAGLTREQAEFQALDRVAETAEGQKVIDSAVKEAMSQIAEEQVWLSQMRMVGVVPETARVIGEARAELGAEGFKVIGRAPNGEANLLQTPEGIILERIATGKQKGWWKTIVGTTEIVAKTPEGVIEIAQERGLVLPKAELAPKAKEPWQMTRAEYYNQEIPKRIPSRKDMPERSLFERTATEVEIKRDHKLSIKQALTEGKPVPAEVLADYPELAAKAPPTGIVTETRMGEGVQVDIFGREHRVAFPSKGVPTQMSMEEYARYQEAMRAKGEVREAPAGFEEAYEAQAQIDVIEETLANDPIAQWRTEITVVGKKKQYTRKVGLESFISIKEKEFPNYLTLKQARQINPHLKLGPYSQVGTKEYNKVPRGVALDELADKWGMTADEIANRVVRIRKERQMLKEHYATIRRQMTETPLPAIPEKTPTEVAENWKAVGKPKYTLEVAKELSGFFGEYIMSEDALSAYELQRALWKKTRAERFQQFRERMEELQIADGLSVEEAFKQAKQETLAGKLPLVSTDFFEVMTADLRDALFSVVYHNEQLQEHPSEMIATLTALTNALTGKPVPRKPGTGSILFPEGGSAWDRLNFVFGEQPKVLQAIDRIATEQKPLSDVIETILYEDVYRPKEHIPMPPIPIDEETAEYLRSLSNFPHGQSGLFEQKYIAPPGIEDLRTPVQQTFASRKLELDIQLSEGKITQIEHDILVSQERDKAYPVAPPTRFDPPIEDAFKQLPMMTFGEKQRFVRILKELGWKAIDIGNLIRANIASVDQSFIGRQGLILGMGNPIHYYHAQVEAWQGMFSQKHTEAAQELISRSPRYEMYERIRLKTGADPLRILMPQKGTEQWRGLEEFGFPSEERLIPRITMKIPWIKWSARGFNTGINRLVWGTWNDCYDMAERRAERIASGEEKLKEGEAFSIEQEIADYQKYLAEVTQRAGLGKVAPLAPVFSATFFALRAKLGRFLAPRHLVSANPRVRMQAWKDFSLTISIMGGFIMLGHWLELWDVERDPRSGEYMSIRIGNMRIDPWAGYRQFAVLYARLVTGTGVSSVTGAEYEVDPLKALWSFTRSSLAPLVSIILDFWTGRNFLGEKVDVANPKQWVERIAPFAIQDIWEAFRDSWKSGVIAPLPAIFGLGVQTYTGDWEENWAKMGLPKYLENLPYGIKEPYYNVADFWADTASQFKGVDPATLTEAKGYPPYIRAIVEADRLQDKLSEMPNQSLASLNADPARGTTFMQYYQMWQDRQKIVASGDEGKLKEFDADERTSKAYMGNMSQRQYALLVEYHSITDEAEQEAFMEEHPELTVNPREDYLRSHPQENAELAVWGKAKVLTKEAYNIYENLAAKLDIPDNALPEGIPPKNIAPTYFDYQDLLKDFAPGSSEALLFRLENEDFEKWGESEYGWKKPDNNIEVLRINVKYREEDKIYDDFKRTARSKSELNAQREAYLIENPGYAEARIRRNGYQQGIPEEWMDTYVEYIETGYTGHRRNFWLMIHRDFYEAVRDILGWEPLDYSTYGERTGLVPFGAGYIRR